MSNEELTPLPNLALTNEAQIRAYVHPLRMSILANLAAEKQTVTAIARQMGVHPANLTHHFKLLEKVGLIRLVEKRDTGKNLEKYYRAVAHSFTVSLGAESNVRPELLALSILRDNLAASIQALQRQPGGASVLAYLKSVRLQPEQALAFEHKLQALLQEFEALDSDAGQAYNLSLALYPGEAGSGPRQEVIIREEK